MDSDDLPAVVDAVGTLSPELAPVEASPSGCTVDFSDTSLSDRMDEWISRQHTLLIAAQENQHRSDQHHLVENDAEITEYPINSYVLYTPPMGRSNKLLPKHRGPYQVTGHEQL